VPGLYFPVQGVNEFVDLRLTGVMDKTHSKYSMSRIFIH
ncbi:uncharacterized protein METZ01_LOCUS455565, partial [marine metagenome]